jgi:hypothetical protein
MDQTPWWDSKPARVVLLALFVGVGVLLVSAAANQVNQPPVSEAAVSAAP